jgi:hypothetical protein
MDDIVFIEDDSLSVKEIDGRLDNSHENEMLNDFINMQDDKKN